MSRPWKPTRQQLADAANKTVADVIAHDLDILFVGINPGLYTAAIGHHFGRPGNRFWPTLHAAGITPRLLSPFESAELLTWKLGITNLVDRATARADELTVEEQLAGAARLEAKVIEYRPKRLAILGVTAYRVAFDRPKAGLGRQAETIGDAEVWVLPNPSGLNAHYQLAALATLFRAMVESPTTD